MSNDFKKYIENLMNSCQDETSYGEPQWWIELESGRCFEITHEEEGLAPEEQYYSVRYHCTDEEFDNDMYHSTVGCIEQFALDSTTDIASNIQAVCERCNEKITDLSKGKSSKTIERD